jgi:opacity protein-like surface antigen
MRAIIATGLLTLPVTALAINTEPAGFYAGVGVSQIDYSGKTHASLHEKPDWTALEFSGGYKHSPFVGVESRLGLGGSPELLYGGLYYRTESANETAKTYLLVGVAGANIKTSFGDDLSLAGPSYGAGLGFSVGKNGNFNLEYRVLVDDSDEGVNLNAISASWDYRFSGAGSVQSFSPEDQGFYLGLGLANIDLKLDESTDEDSVDDEDTDSEPDISWNAVELIGGYSHNPLATVELRLGTTDNAGAEGVDLSLNYISAYYRPSFNLGKVDLYGLLGYSSVRWTFEAESYEYDGEVYEGEKESETFSGISLGAGVNATVTEKITLGLEYRLLAREELEGEGYKDTWDYTAVSANVHYRF